MDEIDIVMKHLRAMGELKPEKPPKEPKKPKEPKAFDPEKATPARQKAYDKRMATYNEKLKTYNAGLSRYTRAFDNWKLNDDRKKILVSQVKLTENGTLLGGSPHRAFMLTGFENEMELDYFIGGEGEKFPDFTKFFPSLDSPLLTLTDITAFRKFCQPLTSVSESLLVILENGVWTFKPNPHDKNPFFQSAAWDLDYFDEPVKFGIDPQKLVDMIMLFEKLKVKEIRMHFVSPVRPIIFETERGNYVICPIRMNF